MKVIEFGAFSDGGSYFVSTDEGFFFLDYRLNTVTEGRLYHGLPEEDNHNIIDNDQALKLQIIAALKEYKASASHPWTDYLIEAFEEAAEDSN